MYVIQDIVVLQRENRCLDGDIHYTWAMSVSLLKNANKHRH